MMGSKLLQFLKSRKQQKTLLDYQCLSTTVVTDVEGGCERTHCNSVLVIVVVIILVIAFLLRHKKTGRASREYSLRIESPGANELERARKCLGGRFIYPA